MVFNKANIDAFVQAWVNLLGVKLSDVTIVYDEKGAFVGVALKETVTVYDKPTASVS